MKVSRAVVGAPSYFERRGRPSQPRELTDHECLHSHPTTDTPPYRWEFTENGRNFAVTVPARVLSTNAVLNRRLAIAGIGITMAYEGRVREALATGQLLSVLNVFCAPFGGYYLYYPQRRSASRALEALVEHGRRWRRNGRSGTRALLT